MNLFDAPRIAAEFSLTAPLRGLHIYRRVAHRRSSGRVYLKTWGWSEWTRRAIHRTLGMKLERGYLHAKKIGGADAFGFYERTSSLPQAAKEDPGSSFIPSSMDGVMTKGFRKAPASRRREAGHAQRRSRRC